MKHSYQTFAYYYDQLIPRAFYFSYCSKITRYQQYSSIIDLGCGSGMLCALLKNDNNSVTGIDLSEEMLMIAQQRNREARLGINYLYQNLESLSLPKNEYDLITCTLDTLNYISNSSSFEHIIKEVSLALTAEGYFWFDVLTNHYFNEVVKDYYLAEDLKDFSYDWHVFLFDESIIKHDLSIISKDEVFNEVHFQYLYEEHFIDDLLKKYQLVIVKKEYEDNELNDKKPSRIYYQVKKEK
ncbi:MAG: class I SAM-dependent methyltransferase [Bacilli bacterium]|jgi:SAM-dependent methyltransferase|nr:class I SAM-dependent methyltransferase [Bacilli bacterium]